jgi:hypothetical protein
MYLDYGGKGNVLGCWWEEECTWMMVERGMYLDDGGKGNVLGIKRMVLQKIL